MQKVGPDWIGCPERRAMELGIIGALAPGIVLAGSAACAAVAVAEPGAVFHEVERARIPDESFTMLKLGDPRRDSTVLRLARKAMVDELPQFIAIVQGKMDLFAPRAMPPVLAGLFYELMEDKGLRDEWFGVRAAQKHGLVSDWAVQLHSRNLEGLAETAVFFDPESIKAVAPKRARSEINDYEQASPEHDLKLLAATARMAVGNYSKYARGFGQRVLSKGARLATV